MIAWWVSWGRLARDRTHYISEVLALPWWPRGDGPRPPGFYESVTASVLFAAGAISFGIAAAIDLGTAWSLGAACSAATGLLLLGVVFFPLRDVPPERIAT